jgi:hypothetical protein
VVGCVADPGLYVTDPEPDPGTVPAASHAENCAIANCVINPLRIG